MVNLKKRIEKSRKWIDKRRFILLLVATSLALILPAFGGNSFFNNILFVIGMSFLLIQSMIVATTKKTKRVWLRYLIAFTMVCLFWMEPLGVKLFQLDIMKLILIVLFFGFISYLLMKFIRNSPKVNANVIITAINLYLMIGIIAGSLAFLFYKLLPDAYNFPSYITRPDFVSFNYYSFITMSTVGYGDITPRLPQTQTLGYMIAVTGQLYVAIIIAFLVGKLLVHAGEDEVTND